MTYLFDNNISFRYANVLKALDVDAVALRELFPSDVRDEDFLRAITGKDFVLVSADRSMRTGLVEAPVLKAAKITSLFLAPFWDKLEFWDQAAWIVRKWPMIDGFVRGAEKGTCALVKQNGRSEILAP